MSKRFFTLVELLMTITILAILLALSLSFLGSIREKTMQTVCLSNYRQVNMSVLLYSIDSRNYFPAYSHTSRTGTPRWNSPYFGGLCFLLRKYLPSGELRSLWNVRHTDYNFSEWDRRVPAALICPAFRRSQAAISGTNPYDMTPGRKGVLATFTSAPNPPANPWQLKYSGAAYTPAGHRLGNLPNPSRYSYASETGWESFVNYELTDPEQVKFRLTKYIYNCGKTACGAFDGTTPYGHRDGWTVLFIDGHVQFAHSKRTHTAETRNGAVFADRVIDPLDL